MWTTSLLVLEIAVKIFWKCQWEIRKQLKRALSYSRMFRGIYSSLPYFVLEYKLFGAMSEEDKRAATNVQNGLVFFILFSFILFRKGLILRESPGGKCVKKCGKVPKRFCPLVVALSFSLTIRSAHATTPNDAKWCQFFSWRGRLKKLASMGNKQNTMNIEPVKADHANFRVHYPGRDNYKIVPCNILEFRLSGRNIRAESGAFCWLGVQKLTSPV